MLASKLIKQEEVEEEAAIERGEIHETRKRGWISRVFLWFGHKFTEFDRAYHRGLIWAIKHRWIVLGGSVLVTGLSLLLVPQIGTEMLPQTDSGDFQVIVRLPVGTALAQTNLTMQYAESIVLKNPDVATVFAAAGTTLSLRGTTTALTPYQGSMTVKLKDDHKATNSGGYPQAAEAVGGRHSRSPRPYHALRPGHRDIDGRSPEHRSRHLRS